MGNKNILALAAFLVLLLFFVPGYFIVIPLGMTFMLLGFSLSSRIAADKSSRLFTIFILSYILRIAIGLVLYKEGLAKGFWGYFYGGDDLAFGDTAIRLANAWRAGIFPSYYEIKTTMSLSNTMGPYQYYLAFLMFISDNNTFLPIFINFTLSSYSVFVIYLLYVEIDPEPIETSREGALFAAGLCAFWPSLIFWSTQNLKEAPTIFCILLVGFIISRILVKKKLIYFLVYGALALLIMRAADLLRPGFSSFFIAGAIAGLISYLVRSVFYKNKFLTILIVTAILLGLTIFFIPESGISENIVKFISAERDFRATGRSVIMPNLKLDTIQNVLSFLPLAAIIAFFYPLPWAASSYTSLLSSPEMIAWYLLFPFLVTGVLSLLNNRAREACFLLGFSAIYFMSIGMLDSNAGTLFRHRALVLPFCFVFIAAGFIKSKRNLPDKK